MEVLPGGKHRAPARGARAGARQDAMQGKQGEGGAYDPRGTGSAWSHNFLNQKPWHPLNFRNQQKVWEAEQADLKAKKEKEIAAAEYAQEQEHLQALAFVNDREAERQRERQSVSFMYTKPPGLDAAMERIKKQETQQQQHIEGGAGGQGGEGGGGGVSDRQATGANATSSQQPGLGPNQQQQRQRPPPLGGSHVAAVLEGIAAVKASQDRYTLKQHLTGTRSPIRGGLDPNDDNQQFVVGGGSEEEEEDGGGGWGEEEQGANGRRIGVAAGQGTSKKKLAKMAKREAERQKLEDAKQFLLAAGLSVEGLDGVGDGGNAGKKSKKSKHKHKKSKHKKSKGSSKKSKSSNKRRRGSDDNDSGSSCSDSGED